MTRLAMLMLVAAVTLFAKTEANAVNCNYAYCVSECGKLGGSGGNQRSGGCASFCEKTLKERVASGACKKQT